MISLVASIFVFGILIFIHEFGHFIIAKRNGVRVEKFSFGFGRVLWRRKIGDTEYLISAVPLGGYIKMLGDEPDEERKGVQGEFLSKSCGQRAQIVAAGAILNYLLAFLLFSFIFIIGSPMVTTRVGQLVEDFPAKAAGIKEDDIILAVDGEKVKYWEDMSGIIRRKTEQKIVLDVKRGNELFKINLTPKIEEYEDIFGQKRKIGLIGIAQSGETTEIKYGLARSFYEGGKELFLFSGLTYKALWLVITRRLPFKESFAGPILIFQLTGSAARLGFIYLLKLMGLLSMSLAIFNFLPVPVLDGGHLFFLLLEKLRRKPVSVRTQQIANQAGIFALVTLFIFVSYYDLLRSGWLEKAAQFWSKIIAK